LTSTRVCSQTPLGRHPTSQETARNSGKKQRQRLKGVGNSKKQRQRLKGVGNKKRRRRHIYDHHHITTTTTCPKTD